MEKPTVKKLRDLGASKLAEAAESTINRLREIGAPDICEDQVIRSILKEAAKSNATTIDLAGRTNPSARPAMGVLRYSFCVLVSFAALVFALGFAIDFKNLVRIARDGRIFFSDGSFNSFGLLHWYPAFLPAFLSAVAAAIAVIAWHFRKR